MLLMDEPINPSRNAPNGAQTLAHDFRLRWNGYQGTEPQHYQAHFNEICEIVEHEKPADDLENQDFDFQKLAPTPGDRNGVADVFVRDHFVMEYKKPGKDLGRRLRSNTPIPRRSRKSAAAHRLRLPDHPNPH